MADVWPWKRSIHPTNIVRLLPARQQALFALRKRTRRQRNMTYEERDTDISAEFHVIADKNRHMLNRHMLNRHIPDPTQTHGVVKQITVEELFGSSLPKNPTPPAETISGESFLRGISYGPPPVPLEPLLTQCLSANPLLPQHSISPGLMVPSGSENVPALGGHRGQTGPQAAPQYINSLKNDGHAIPKPTAVPGFMPSTLVTPQSFREPTPKAPAVFTSKPAASAQTKEAGTFAQPQAPNLVKPIPTKAGLVVPGQEPSLLLSPSVFQQSTTKAPELPRNPAPPPSPPASLGTAELPSTVYSKAQLQDVLIHLIKNDAHFLSTIHEAYMQSITKDLSNVKL
ncbi:mRNA-decapping enzyme 1A isoform X1 [Tachysurus ichikawai]